MRLFPLAWKSERQPDSVNRASDCISLILNLYTYLCNWIDVIGFPDFTEGEIIHSIFTRWPRLGDLSVLIGGSAWLPSLSGHPIAQASGFPISWKKVQLGPTVEFIGWQLRFRSGSFVLAFIK